MILKGPDVQDCRGLLLVTYSLTLRCRLLHAKPRQNLASRATSELHNVCFSLSRYFVACLLGSSAGLA